MIKARKVELRPNNKQRTLFRKHAGVARHAWNWGLATCKAILDQRAKEREVGEVTTKFPSAIDLHKRLVAEVKPICPWYYEVSKCSPQQALCNLSKAFKRMFKVPGTGFPKFKKKNGKTSFYLEDPNRPLNHNGRKVKLPVIGWVRCKEVIPDVPFKSVVVSERAGRWFMSFKIEVEKPAPIAAIDTIGVDLGVKTFATLSTGEVFDKPRRFDDIERKIKRTQRQMMRREKGSKRREKSKRRLSRLYYRQSCLRIDVTQKLTTTLAKNHGVIVVEDLGVRGMMSNHHLAASIAAAHFYEVRRQLAYKCEFYGSRLVVVNRFFPSSQLCSGCLARQKMPLGISEYHCPACGLRLDRDVNAARNLAASSAVNSPLESGGSCHEAGAGIATGN